MKISKVLVMTILGFGLNFSASAMHTRSNPPQQFHPGVTSNRKPKTHPAPQPAIPHIPTPVAPIQANHVQQQIQATLYNSLSTQVSRRNSPVPSSFSNTHQQVYRKSQRYNTFYIIAVLVVVAIIIYYVFDYLFDIKLANTHNNIMTTVNNLSNSISENLTAINEKIAQFSTFFNEALAKNKKEVINLIHNFTQNFEALLQENSTQITNLDKETKNLFTKITECLQDQNKNDLYRDKTFLEMLQNIKKLLEKGKIKVKQDSVYGKILTSINTLYNGIRNIAE